LADYLLYLRDVQYGNVIGQFKPDNLSFSIRNSEPGEISFELPLGQPNLTFMQFGPYRTDYALYRAGSAQNYRLIVEGMLTSVNLSDDRDSVICAGKDWLHYLQHRTYPFDPVTYQAGGWDQWPVGWPHHPGVKREKMGNPVEVRDIVEDILQHMMDVTLPPLPGGVAGGPGMGQLPIIFNNVATGTKTKYKILPGDTTTVFDHITKLSDQVRGFEFDILPQSLEFKMWSPGRWQNLPVYVFDGTIAVSTESGGQIVHIDWTNDGPDGTFLVGLGTSGRKVGATWYYRRSIEKYRWLDMVYDYGEVPGNPDDPAADFIFQLLKDQNDLYPQEKLSLTLLNPETLSSNSGSFYTADRPRSVIGQMVRVIFNFPPYWKVDREYRVNALNWTVDANSNEEVEFELEIIFPDEQT
jgi:hypothetical protein